MNQKEKHSHSRGGKRSGSGRKRKRPTTVVSFRVDETLKDEFKTEALFLLNNLKLNHMKKLLLISLLFLGCAKVAPPSSISVVLKGKQQQLNITKKTIDHIHGYFDITSEIKDTILTIYSVGSKGDRTKISKNVRVSPIAHAEVESELLYNKSITVNPFILNGETHELNKSIVIFNNFQ